MSEHEEELRRLRAEYPARQRQVDQAPRPLIPTPPVPVAGLVPPSVAPPGAAAGTATSRSPGAVALAGLRRTLQRFAPPHRGVWLGVLAALVGAAGEGLLFQEATRGVGAVGLLTAVVLAALAWGGMRDAPLLTPRRAPWPVPRQRRVALRLLGIAGALALYAASLRAWQADPAAIWGRQGTLWVAAMALLLLSCARWYPAASRETDLGPAWTRGEVLLFLAILALSLLTHLVALEDIPWRVDPNEHIAFLDSMNFYRGTPLSAFGSSWMGTGMPSFWFALTGGLMHLAGTGLLGVRLCTALFGGLLVIPLYGLARLLGGRAAAIGATGAWAITTGILHYTRTAFPNIGTPFTWVVCFYFLLRGLRSRRPGDFVWAGLAAGLSMYTYYGTRLLPYLLLAFFGYLLVFHFRACRERIAHFALVPLGFFIGFGPLLLYFMQNPTLWSGRLQEELLFPLAIPHDWDGVLQIWNPVSAELQRNFLALSVIPAQDSFFWAPLFLPAEVVLIFLGLGLVIRRWREPGAFLVLLWGASIMLVVSSISITGNENPNFLHWSATWPVFPLLMALPPATWLRAVRRLGPRWGRVGQVALAGGFLCLAGANFYRYLVIYPPQVPPPADFYTLQGRYLKAMPPGTLVHFIGRSDQQLNWEIAGMLAPHTTAGATFNPSRDLPLPGTPGHGQAFVFYGDTVPYLPLVRTYYPGGQVQEWRAATGDYLATTYQLSAAQVMAGYGVTVTLRTTDPGARLIGEARVGHVGALPEGQVIPYPVRATWTGAFFVPRAGSIQLSAQGPTGAQITVPGQPQAGAGPIAVDGGWLPFTMQATLAQPTPLRLLMQQGTDPPAEIPTTQLWPVPAGQGLAVTRNGAGAGRRIDPFVGAALFAPGPLIVVGDLPPSEALQYYLDFPLAPADSTSTALRWAGEVYAEGGDYTMALRTDARARLMIDQTSVVTLCNSPDGTATNTINLAPGWHPVILNLQIDQPGKGLEWIWSRPDGLAEIVPPTRLRYSWDGAEAAPGAGAGQPALLPGEPDSRAGRRDSSLAECGR